MGRNEKEGKKKMSKGLLAMFLIMIGCGERKPLPPAVWGQAKWGGATWDSASVDGGAK